jgi:hypothetical protein
MLPAGTIQLEPTGEVTLCSLTLEGKLLGGASILIMGQGANEIRRFDCNWITRTVCGCQRRCRRDVAGIYRAPA